MFTYFSDAFYHEMTGTRDRPEVLTAVLATYFKGGVTPDFAENPTEVEAMKGLIDS